MNSDRSSRECSVEDNDNASLQSTTTQDHSQEEMSESIHGSDRPLDTTTKDSSVSTDETSNQEASNKTIIPEPPASTHRIDQDTKKTILAERSSLTRHSRRREGPLSSSLTTTTTTSHAVESSRQRTSTLTSATNALHEAKIGIATRSCLPPDLERGSLVVPSESAKAVDKESIAKCTEAVVPGAFAISSFQESFQEPFQESFLPNDDEHVSPPDSSKATTLPLAQVVGCHDENGLPAAVEFDPDAKVASPRRDWKPYVVLCTTVSVILGILISLVVAASNDRIPRDAMIRQSLLQQLDELDFSIPAYEEALHWIVREDYQTLDANHPFLSQRFAVAAMYFATQPWDFCTASLEDDQCTGDTSISTGIRWLAGSYSECDWVGVLCDEYGFIRHIHLAGIGLKGRFPQMVSWLSTLERLDLSYNALSGTIPTLSERLQLVRLRNNHFTGSVPSLAHMGELQYWDVSNNALRGTLSDLFERAEDAGVDGTKAGKGLLTELSSVSLTNNLLTGTIPESLFACTALEALELSGNQLHGTLNISFWNQLKWLRLGDNAMTGTLPTEFPKTLNALDVSNNRFTGNLTNCARTDRLVQADCLGDPPEVSCDCCTTCCSPEGTCVEMN